MTYFDHLTEAAILTQIWTVRPFAFTVAHNVLSLPALQGFCDRTRVVLTCLQDMLSWLMGPVAEVSGASSATLAHERVEVEDTVVATLRFANGALGVVEASTAAYPGAMKRLEICGSGGSALLEEQNVTR